MVICHLLMFRIVVMEFLHLNLKHVCSICRVVYVSTVYLYVGCRKNLLSPDLGVGKKYGRSENPEICQEFPPEVPGQEAESSSCGHPGSLEGARSTKRVKA